MKVRWEFRVSRGGITCLNYVLWSCNIKIWQSHPHITIKIKFYHLSTWYILHKKYLTKICKVTATELKFISQRSINIGFQIRPEYFSSISHYFKAFRYSLNAPDTICCPNTFVAALTGRHQVHAVGPPYVSEICRQFRIILRRRS